MNEYVLLMFNFILELLDLELLRFYLSLHFECSLLHLILQVTAHVFSLFILHYFVETFKELAADQIIKHVHLLFFLLDYHVFDELLTNGAPDILLRLRFLKLFLLFIDCLEIFLELLLSDVVDVEDAVTDHFLLQALAEGYLSLFVLLDELLCLLLRNWIDGEELFLIIGPCQL